MKIFDPHITGSLSVSASAEIQGDLIVSGTIKGDQTISGSLLPETTIVHDLGSDSQRWRDLYLAGNTIDLGGTKIGRNDNGDVELKDGSNNLKKIIASEIEIGEGNGRKIIKISNGKLKLTDLDNTKDESAQLSGSFTGTFVGDGAGLTNVPASAVTGLNLTGYTTTDYFVTGATFGTGDGIITLTRNDGNTVTVDIDGRYIRSGSDSDASLNHLGVNSISAFADGGNTGFSYGQMYISGGVKNGVVVDARLDFYGFYTTDIIRIGFDQSGSFSIHNPGGGSFEMDIDGTLLVKGVLRSEGDVVAFFSSDKRLKDNIEQIPKAIDKIQSIGGYNFNWNDKQDTYEVGSRDIGVVAQEIEEVLPELVTTRDNGYKAVKYEKIVALLIEGIKEQQEQINELKTKLDGITK